MNATKITIKTSTQKTCSAKKHNLNSRCKSFLDKNTLNKSNQNLFQSNFRQFRELILPHVFLAMAKSHIPSHVFLVMFYCIITFDTIVSKVATSMRVLCDTFAREYKYVII